MADRRPPLVKEKCEAHALAVLMGRLIVYSGAGAIIALAGVGIGLVVIAVRRMQVRDDVGVIGDALLALVIGAVFGALCFALRELSAHYLPNLRRDKHRDR